MDKTESTEIARAVMRDKTPVVVHVNVSDAWILLGAIQQQIRNYPALKPFMKTKMFHLAAQLEIAILRIHPESRDLIDGGWDFSEHADDIREQVSRFLVSSNSSR